uniref:transmembrane and coiled-coil domain-containing protein 5B-like isoform X2 n=1 Tax=Callithrix jacchus TaxID=9483 RepID=UPI00159E84D6|nr:transmembrane and coiled-coil domain-containing protein 5B-like isoform X2 [Callithrix jacchus]
MMEDVGQNPLDDVCQMMELPALEAIKQNLDCLNSDLEKDLQKLDMENQVLLRKIKEKEETISSLERELARSLEQAKEEEELTSIINEQEESLRELELETAKLKKSNAVLSRNVVELQNKISGQFTNVSLEKETTEQKLEEIKARLQKTTGSCAKQEEELAKMESDYLSVHELCKDQVYYVKKYQEALRKMEEEEEVLLLEKEISKAQNVSSQIVKQGSVLVDTTQSNMEKTTIKKQERICWYKGDASVLEVLLRLQFQEVNSVKTGSLYDNFQVQSVRLQRRSETGMLKTRSERLTSCCPGCPS